MCAGSTTDNCASGSNAEYAPEGYFWVVKVTSGAVGKPITLQLYDPAYVDTGGDCQDLPRLPADFSNNPNPFVSSDGKSSLRQGHAQLLHRRAVLHRRPPLGQHVPTPPWSPPSCCATPPTPRTP